MRKKNISADILTLVVTYASRCFITRVLFMLCLPRNNISARHLVSAIRFIDISLIEPYIHYNNFTHAVVLSTVYALPRKPFTVISWIFHFILFEELFYMHVSAIFLYVLFRKGKHTCIPVGPTHCGSYQKGTVAIGVRTWRNTWPKAKWSSIIITFM